MKMTKKDLRAIELYNKYNRKNLAENLEDYRLFLDTLIYLHEVVAEAKIHIKYWQKLSETLLYKFTYHGLTIHSIVSGIELKSNYYKELSGVKIIDVASVKVVLRAQLESFLMYHHIYVNSGDIDLQELRYNAWVCSGLMQRQKFPAETEFAKEQKAKDLVEIEKMKLTIKNLESFKSLTAKQQQSLLDNGSGKLFSHWEKIITETFSEHSQFHQIYNLLSMYSHSEGISIIQLEYQPGAYQNMLNQAFIDVHQSKLLVCFMITSVMSLFDVVRDRFKELPEDIRYDIELYSEIVRAT